MRLWTLVALVAFALIAGAASTETDAVAREAPKGEKRSDRAEARRCPAARRALTFYRLRKASWLQLRGVDASPEIGQPTGCVSVRRKLREERNNSVAARRAYARWVEEHSLVDYEVQPGNRAWHRAVREAQRAYPGTEAWLLSCSSTEGGWGRWVPNSDGAPPGGWMQMYHSTWHSMWYGWYGDVGAYRSLVSRGFIVPRSAHSWYSPLGQALASAHGKTHGRGGEWHSSGCY